MCALSGLLSNPPAPINMVDRYYSEARRLILESMDEPSVEMLQGVLVVAIVSMLRGRITAVFMLIGIAARMLSLMKIERIPESFENLPNLSAEDRETIQRCFLTLLGTFSDRPVSLAPNQSSTSIFGQTPAGVLSDSEWYNLPGRSFPEPLLSNPDHSSFDLPIPDSSFLGGMSLEGGAIPAPSRLFGASGSFPHLLFAGRIMGLLHDITKNVGVDGGDDGYGFATVDELSSERFERDAMFEARLEGWFSELPEDMRADTEELIQLGSIRLTCYISSDVDPVGVAQILMRFMLLLLYQTCLLQLHRPRVTLRRRCMAVERAWINSNRMSPKPPFFDPMISRRLDRSSRVCFQASRNIISILEVADEGHSRVWPAELSEQFDPIRRSPVNTFCIAVACLGLVEDWVCVRWGRLFDARGMGVSWVGEERWDDETVEKVVVALEKGLRLMEAHQIGAGKREGGSAGSFLIDTKWVGLLREVVEIHRRGGVGVEMDEEEYLERLERLLVECGGAGRVPFGGVLGAFL
ncbi:hypothetical protein HDU67_007889 [Dinochytrium kinnereticum]|nr:hypothetical protein HDU67_007889 [Dinochytrium kinnereticum]